MIRWVCILALCAGSSAMADEAWTAWLVRHAEKAGGPDPQLSDQGRDRAGHLADLLSSAGVETVWTSDYRRTRQTAAPLVARLALPLAVYDARRLDELADALRAAGETVVVVGHSNTTPQLVRLLGGVAVDMEEWRYDRVYQLRIGADGSVETRLLHLPPLSLAPVTTDTETASTATDNSTTADPKGNLR